MIAKLRRPFHIPGKYVLLKALDDDGREYDYPSWIPGVDHDVGEWFNVQRRGKACGIYGIEDGTPVALCYRELKPITDDTIGEAEILAIPMSLLEIREDE